MGTVITAQDVQNSAKVVSNLPALPTPSTPFGDMNLNLSEIQKLATTFESILSKVQAIRGMVGEKKQQQQFPLRGSPDQITSTNNPPQQQQPSKVKTIVKKTDQEKLSALIFDLLKRGKDSIPQEVQDMKIESLLGENIKTFQFKHKGITVQGTDLVKIIAQQLALAIDQMNENEPEQST